LFLYIGLLELKDLSRIIATFLLEIVNDPIIIMKIIEVYKTTNTNVYNAPSIYCDYIHFL